MAGSIKGITVKIGGDTTGLDKALKSVNSQISNTQSELREVKKLLKLDPTNTELLKQKQELLAKSIEQTSNKLKTLKEAEKKAKEELKNNESGAEQYRELQREIIKTEQSLKSLESQAAKSNATLNKIGNTAANVANKTKVISTAAAGALTGIGAAATAFEDDFAKVSTLLDKSTVDYENYKKTILEASSSTGIAAGEFSDATYQALSAGVAAKDAVNFTTIAAKLAKGGMTDAASAVDIITTALNAYGMEASNAEHVSDVLVQIQNKGKTTVSELASNMGRAIPTANAYGVSLEQLGTVYSIITSKGVATAESTTYISAMLNELGKSGTKASTELQEATGKSFAQLMSDGQSLGDVIKILSDRANQTGLSLNDMFGSAEAGKAALTLAADGAESFNNAVKGMEESAGTAQEAYEKIAGTPLEKAKKSLNEAKNSMIEAGQNMLPTIAEITKLISKATSAFSEMSPAAQKVALGAIALTAAISPTAKVIQGLTTVTGTAKNAYKKLTAAYKKKTAATVEDTAANVTNAKSLDKTAKSAEKTSKGISGIGAAAKSASPYVLSVLAASAMLGTEISRTISTAQKKIEKAYDEKVKKSNDTYKVEISNLTDEYNAYDKKMTAEISKEEKLYNDRIANLDKDLKAQKSAIETEKKLYEEAHKVRLSQLEKERDAKLAAISAGEEAQTAELQSEIDALNALTEAEEKAKQEQENAQKLEDLKQAISFAKTYAEKVDAENNYTAEVKRQEEEKTKNARGEQIKQLQNKIEQIKSESSARQEQVKSEYDEAVRLENDKYEIAQEGFENRLSALDDFVESETERLEALRDKNISIMQSETDSYLAELQKRIDKQNELKEAAAAAIEKEKESEVEKVKTPMGFFKAFVSDYNIPKNASGTNDWRGGLTYVHEQGAELINLPQHTQIIPHDLSVEYMRELARQKANSGNTYYYGAQQQVTVLSVDGKNIAEVVEPRVSVKMSDNIYRRRRSGGAR